MTIPKPGRELESGIWILELTTLDTYSHVLPTMQQQAADRLEGVLFGTRDSRHLKS